MVLPRIVRDQQRAIRRARLSVALRRWRRGAGVSRLRRYRNSVERNPRFVQHIVGLVYNALQARNRRRAVSRRRVALRRWHRLAGGVVSRRRGLGKRRRQ